MPGLRGRVTTLLHLQKHKPTPTREDVAKEPKDASPEPSRGRKTLNAMRHPVVTLRKKKGAQNSTQSSKYTSTSPGHTQVLPQATSPALVGAYLAVDIDDTDLAELVSAIDNLALEKPSVAPADQAQVSRLTPHKAYPY